MTSILYIVPYFGKLREDFPLWLKTCEYNPTVDWIVLTDDRTEYVYPDNVRVEYMTFEEAAGMIEKAVGFPISLENPYKLCDFKPVYGKAFAEYSEGYGFWGHCDMDLLWGDIRAFLTEEILANYNKIGFLGHSTLYRNTDEVNGRWHCEGDSKVDFREAFTSRESKFFDERGMNEIYASNGWPVYREQIFADLTEYRYNFFMTNVADEDAEKNNKQIFVWDHGKLYRKYLDGKLVCTDEFMYIHFLKRKMKLEVSGKEKRWLIVPNTIMEFREEPSYRIVKKYSRSHWGKYFAGLFREKRSQVTPGNVVRFILRRGKKYYALKHNNAHLNDQEM